MLTTGTTAPAFSLRDQNGDLHSLSDYRGQTVILYFYPKDMTGGGHGKKQPDLSADLTGGSQRNDGEG